MDINDKKDKISDELIFIGELVKKLQSSCGIENNFETIDFGQTADESKFKLGSKYIKLYAYLHDSNKLRNFINKKLARFIEYKPITTDYQVFKEDK